MNVNDDEILSIECPRCSPGESVGAVVRACLDGVVACEGCHRERGYVWMRDRRVALQATIRAGVPLDSIDWAVRYRSLVLGTGANAKVLPLDTPLEEIARLIEGIEGVQ